MRDILINLKKVFEYGKEYKNSLIIQVFCSVIRVVLGVILPLFAAQQIVYLTDNSWEQLVYASIIILLLNMLQNLNTLVFRKNTQVFRRGTVKNIQLRLSNEILKLKQKELESDNYGKYIQRIVSDTDNMSLIFTSGMSNLTSVASVFGVFIAAFFLNKKVFLFYSITTFLLVILQIKKTKKYTAKDREYRIEVENVVGVAGQLVRGSKDIKVLNSKKSFVKSMKSKLEKQILKNFEMRHIDIVYNFFIDTVKALFEVLLVLLLIRLSMNKEIEPAIAIALFTYRTNAFSNFIERIAVLLNELSNFKISAHRVFDIIESTKDKKEEFGHVHLDEILGNIEFDNVSFGYKTNTILKNMSFKINANETVAIVGKSGGGKSSIYNLICKLYEVNEGNVLIDGNNINDLDEETIRKNIAIVSQNPYIFNMSIKENFQLVKEDVTDEEIKEICRLAYIDDYIENLPNKYDTIVGESGVNLSGGQKQRLAIARAFLQDARILLFDEATSALDNETQSNIQKTINSLKHKCTVLIIAHRLSTIINSDRILVVDNGQVVAEGKHRQLLKTNETYKKLYESEHLINNM